MKVHILYRDGDREPEAERQRDGERQTKKKRGRQIYVDKQTETERPRK